MFAFTSTFAFTCLQIQTFHPLFSTLCIVTLHKYTCPGKVKQRKAKQEVSKLRREICCSNETMNKVEQQLKINRAIGFEVSALTCTSRCVQFAVTEPNVCLFFASASPERPLIIWWKFNLSVDLSSVAFTF